MHLQQHAYLDAWPSRIRDDPPRQLQGCRRPPRRPYPDRSVPEAVVTCLAEACAPTQREIEAVARRMSADIWVSPRSDDGVLSRPAPTDRELIALARVALGLSPVARGDGCGSGEQA